jgi:Thiol-activated cytolysin
MIARIIPPRITLLAAGLLMAGFLMLASCSSDDGPAGPTDPVDTTKADWDALIASAGTYVNPVGEDEPTRDRSDEVTVTEDRSDGSRWTCTSQQVDLQSAPDDFILMNAAPDIYPGSLLRGNSINNFPPHRIAVNRGGGEITVDLKSTVPSSSVVQLDSITPGLVNQAMDDILTNRPTGDFADRFSMKFQSVESEEDLRIALKAQASGTAWEAEGEISFRSNRKYNRYLVTLTQLFYTMTYTPPNDRSKFFADGVNPSDISPLDIGPDNPPVFVRTVNYGRLVNIMIESTSSLVELESKVKLSYDAAVSSGSIDIAVDYVSSLDNVEVTAIVYGGKGISPGDLTGDFEALKAALSAPQTIVAAVPISYTMEDVRNFDTVKVQLATSYEVKNCTPVAAGLDNPIFIWDAASAEVTETSSNQLWYTQSTHDHWANYNIESDNLPPARATKWVTGVPDGANNGHELVSDTDDRPHLVDDPIATIDGQVIEFCNIYELFEAEGLAMAHTRFRDAHLGYVQTDLEGKSYTLFTIINKPSSVKTTAGYQPANFIDLVFDVPHVAGCYPGMFMFQTDGGTSLTFGSQSSQDVFWGHSLSTVGTVNDVWPEDQFVVAAIQYNADTEEARLFIDGVIVGVATYAPLSPITGLSWLGARPTSNLFPFGQNTSFQMRLTEAYEGAVLDETIIQYSADLKAQYNF